MPPFSTPDRVEDEKVNSTPQRDKAAGLIPVKDVADEFRSRGIAALFRLRRF